MKLGINISVRNTLYHITACKKILAYNNIRYININVKLSQLKKKNERYDAMSIFKRSLTGLNLEFSFSSASLLTKAEELSLPYYLPIAGGRIIGFIPFPRVLVLCEMQSVTSSIWTLIAVSIS